MQISSRALAIICVVALCVIGLVGYYLYKRGMVVKPVGTGSTQTPPAGTGSTQTPPAGSSTKTKTIDLCNPYERTQCPYTGNNFTCGDYWTCMEKRSAITGNFSGCSSDPAFSVCGGARVSTLASTAPPTIV